MELHLRCRRLVFRSASERAPLQRRNPEIRSHRSVGRQHENEFGQAGTTAARGPLVIEQRAALRRELPMHLLHARQQREEIRLLHLRSRSSGASFEENQPIAMRKPPFPSGIALIAMPSPLSAWKCRKFGAGHASTSMMSPRPDCWRMRISTFASAGRLTNSRRTSWIKASSRSASS